MRNRYMHTYSDSRSELLGAPARKRKHQRKEVLIYMLIYVKRTRNKQQNKMLKTMEWNVKKQQQQKLYNEKREKY